MDWKQPYLQKSRERTKGSISLGTSIELAEDYYALTFLHQLRRRYVFDDGLDSEEELPPTDAQPEQPT